ncbi:MAG: flavin-containing monooxygenase [Alcanivoracaceae bacterium]
MYAVIGAGPMGLCTARNLKKYGIDFVGFEIHSDVGGLWDIDSSTSTMYDTAHLISSKRMTEFTEFPMKESVATYPHHSELKTYFRDYASHFGLYDHYEFNTEVVSVTPEGEQWRVVTRSGDEEQSRLFDGVLVANGTLHHPHMPKLPGDFSGELMHASTYRSPEVFKDKRVLVIGCGNSGADIAVDAVHFARSVDISVRRGYYFLPKFLMGKPVDTLGGRIKLPPRLKQIVDGLLVRAVMGKPSDYGLPDPDYRMYESHPVINSLILHHLGHGDIHARRDIRDIQDKTVFFSNGEQAEYDLILMATGYELHYPFLDRGYMNWPEGAGAPQLYLNVFNPAQPNLFIMGMVEAAGLGWEGRNEQAEMVALYLRQRADNAPSAKRLQQTIRDKASIRLDGGLNYLQLDRMAYYVNKEAYRGQVRDTVKALRADMSNARTQAA